MERFVWGLVQKFIKEELTSHIFVRYCFETHSQIFQCKTMLHIFYTQQYHHYLGGDYGHNRGYKI